MIGMFSLVIVNTNNFYHVMSNIVYLEINMIFNKTTTVHQILNFKYYDC